MSIPAKKKRKIAATHLSGVVKEEFAGLMGVLMTKVTASTENTFLSLISLALP